MADSIIPPKVKDSARILRKEFGYYIPEEVGLLQNELQSTPSKKFAPPDKLRDKLKSKRLLGAYQLLHLAEGKQESGECTPRSGICLNNM